MIRGSIAIPSAKSLKRLRPKRKARTYPENMPAIVTPKSKQTLAWERYLKLTGQTE